MSIVERERRNPHCLSGRITSAMDFLAFQKDFARISPLLRLAKWLDNSQSLRCTSFCIKRPITWPIRRPITRPITWPITRPITRPITQLITRPITRPITWSITQLITRPITRPITRQITRSITLTIKWPTTRPITQSINGQSPNQSNSQPPG